MAAPREPPWWYEPDATWQSRFLSPLSGVIGKVAARRIRRPPAYKSRLPVICIGNFTVGGSGKTPLALLVAELVLAAGKTPWFLSRGYGGSLRGPVRVGANTAAEVGDEPLLLARLAPTVIARDRRAGAILIEQSSPANGVIIMDDGLQNSALFKDLTIAVVDARRGIGNGRVIPSGPLRAPMNAQSKLANLLVLTGDDASNITQTREALLKYTPVEAIFAATRPQAPDKWRGRRVVAFAGIANPNRFFDMLKNLGAEVAECHTFADHHAFSHKDAKNLLAAASAAKATLVTTEKDIVRISTTTGALGDLRRKSEALGIRSTVEDADLAILTAQIARAISA